MLEEKKGRRVVVCLAVVLQAGEEKQGKLQLVVVVGLPKETQSETNNNKVEEQQLVVFVAIID